MKIMILGVALLTLVGCAVQKEWVATGGSRSDGTVKLAYQYGAFEKPVLSDQQAYDVADSRCGAWGFSGSEAFGGTISECQSHDGYGNCNSWIVTAEFQCID